MIQQGKLKTRDEDGTLFVEAALGISSIVPASSLSQSPRASLIGNDFVKKTIGTILNLHEKVLDAKDETLEFLKNENRFLKEALFSMLELYDKDKKTIETLRKKL